MPSRIVIHGRTRVASRDYRQNRPALPPRNKAGDVIEDFRVDVNEAPFREGEAFFDVEEQIEFRVVNANRLRPADGWGTGPFWCKRWKCTGKTLRDLVLRGMLDAAMEVDSQVRRFRCRDEQRAVNWIAEVRAGRVKP